MNKKASAGIVCLLGLIAIISSQALTLSDFLGGFILGMAIVAEVISVYVLAKEMKANKVSEN